MVKKTNVRAEDITEKDILSLYEAVLPLLIHNPEKVHPANRLKRCLEKFIPFDFGYYAMESLETPLSEDKRFLIFEDDPLNYRKEFSTLLADPVKRKKGEQTFDKMVEHAYQRAIKDEEEFFKKKVRPFHYYSMVSDTYPKIAVGYFRYKNGDNPFNESEIKAFELFSPHIFLINRAIVSFALHSDPLKYFAILNKISQSLAKKYKLSVNEYKLIPEILSGLTNEEIAEKYFITVSGVKKTLTQIFKKTHSKNRTDFISKFFTSPELTEV